MSAPSKACAIQSVKIRPEERLATTSELNLAPSSVTNCREAKGMGYWAATQVKVLSPERTNVVEVEPLHFVEGSINSTVKGEVELTPPGSKAVARYQRDSRGTREAQSALHRGVCNNKPIDGELLQKALWESDQLIVAKKQGNACGAKGLAGEPLEQGHFLQTQNWSKEANETVSITNREVLLKSRMRENLKSGSVRGLIVAPEENFQRRWL